MTRKRRRMYLLLASAVTLAAATGLVLSAFKDSIVFFYSPTEIKTKPVPTDRLIRVGGLVAKGSIKHGADGRVSFVLTDTANSVRVTYRGVLPDLFREGQGVVAQGRLAPDGSFTARQVLAKHDETYMPKEVADALKAAGQWHPGGKEGPPR